MVDAVSCPAVPQVVTFALGVAGVVADEPGTADQEMEQEAQQLHADGDQEEDERVPPLVGDQQLGEDAGEGDDDPRRACSSSGWRGETGGAGQKGAAEGGHSLSPVITPCVYLLGSIPM